MLGYLRFRFCLWQYETADAWRRRIANALPREIALLVFVRVYAAGNPNAPGADYAHTYDAWVRGAGR